MAITYNFKGEFLENKTYKTKEGVTALVSKVGNKINIGISHKDREPTLEEIREARYQLVSLDINIVHVIPNKATQKTLKDCVYLREI